MGEKYDVRISSPPGGFLAFILALSGSTHLFMRAVKFNMQQKHSAQKIPPDSQEKPQGFTEIPLSFVGFFVFIVVVI